MVVAATTGAISCAKCISQIVTTNKVTPILMRTICPSCRPTNSVRALKGKYHISQTCLTKFEYLQMSMGSPGDLPTLSLTTNSSCLPWGRGCHACHQPSDASTPNITDESSSPGGAPISEHSRLHKLTDATLNDPAHASTLC